MYNTRSFTMEQLDIAEKAYSSYKVKLSDKKMIDSLDPLFKATLSHLRELDYVEKRLAKIGNRLALISGLCKTSLIIFGAVIATKEVTSQFVGKSTFITIAYTIIGLLIAVIAGLEAAFKWEKKSGEISNIATTSRTIKRDYIFKLTEVFANTNKTDTLNTLKEIIKSLDVKISNIQAEVSKFGVNNLFDTRNHKKHYGDY